MPVQKTDRDTQWNLSEPNKTWTLAEKATITVANQWGIYESTSGSEIKVLGDIRASGDFAGGVSISGSNSSLLVGEDSRINAKQADYGIYAAGAGSDLVNKGLIESGQDGIHGAIWSDVKNFGTIKGAQNGIYYEGGGSQIYNYGKIEGSVYGIRTEANDSYIMNDKGAEISSDQIALAINGLGDMKILNKGTIRSDDLAIDGGDSALHVINKGKIFGDVVLGEGQDIFDTRKGTVQGVIYGGEDGDDYRIANSNIKIVEEEVGGMTDRVLSSASYKLGANIEQLILIGKKDIDGTGGNTDNTMKGNEGDNKLSGKNGDDMFDGGAGNDILTGDMGQDVFAFVGGYDKDTITDFENGTDLIFIQGVESLQDFQDLNIKQTKQNVVIDLGDGDKLIIENTLKSDIDYADMYVV